MEAQTFLMLPTLFLGLSCPFSISTWGQNLDIFVFSASDTLEFKLEEVKGRVLPLDVVHNGYLYPISFSFPISPETSIKALSLISFDSSSCVLCMWFWG